MLGVSQLIILLPCYRGCEIIIVTPPPLLGGCTIITAHFSFVTSVQKRHREWFMDCRSPGKERTMSRA